MSTIFEDLAQCVISGDADKTKEMTEKAVADGADPLGIVNEGLMAGMRVVGARFKAMEMFVPEVLLAARAMKGGIEVVKPLISDTDMPSEGKVVMGTVSGDLHDIGKNLVSMMLESAGFQVIDLGFDVSPAAFAKAVKENDADVVGMSAMLTTTMLSMKDTVELFKEEGVRDGVGMIIGGAPVTKSFADEIGADGWGQDAGAAIELCKELIANKGA